jgi:hypothetical protein
MHTNKLKSSIRSVVRNIDDTSPGRVKKPLISLKKPIRNTTPFNTIPDDYCEKAWKEFQVIFKKAQAEHKEKKKL